MCDLNSPDAVHLVYRLIESHQASLQRASAIQAKLAALTGSRAPDARKLASLLERLVELLDEVKIDTQKEQTLWSLRRSPRHEEVVARLSSSNGERPALFSMRDGLRHAASTASPGIEAAFLQRKALGQAFAGLLAESLHTQVSALLELIDVELETAPADIPALARRAIA